MKKSRGASLQGGKGIAEAQLNIYHIQHDIFQAPTVTLAGRRRRAGAKPCALSMIVIINWMQAP